ncbi:MAG: acyltransferase domain-containing protein [Proteobacteria bacterium]|nr:acyltransferase domain-containing protein [Pseudomonadota bacterium]
MSRYDIAVIGMGGVFPGALNVEKYWENIVNGNVFIKDMPETLWRLKNFYNPEKGDPAKSYTMAGSFIEGFQFDPLKYKMPPANMRGIDPTQLMAITAVEEALKDAGIPFRDPSLTEGITVIGASGVDGFAHSAAFLKRHTFLKYMKPVLDAHGVDSDTWQRLYDEMTAELDERGHIWNASIAAVGAIPSSVSNRIAQLFGIRGMNMTVDGACASSFVAIDTACQALMSGDARVAVAGGADLGVNPPIYIGFCRVDGLSASGRSCPFDATADGLVIGEGVGMVVLKRLEDALEDGDNIRAVIRGIGSSSDGAGQAIYNPSIEGRALALRNALQNAQTTSDEVQFIEAHATSTIVGDANEYDAISMVYGKRNVPNPIRLGSVKYQIGHLKAAAGVAGLIKTVLAMEHEQYPHMPLYRSLTPGATMVTDALTVPQTMEPWVPNADGKRVAAVTASGFGGVNYHLIVEQGDAYEKPQPRPQKDRRMAIVGVSMRVAGADNKEKFWDNITRGVDTFTAVTDPAKFGWEMCFDTGPESEMINTYVVSEVPDYDPNLLKHKIFPTAASQIAPTQLLGLDTADRLLEEYGFEYRTPKNIGVSLGALHDDYFPTIFYPMLVDEYIDAVRCTDVSKSISEAALQEGFEAARRGLTDNYPPVTEHTLPGWMMNVTAGRIANKLNLQGPNFTVDTACSSGLAAMLPASYQLMYGNVDLMITGGLNRQFSDTFTSGVCALGAVGKTEARPFDAAGKGYLLGEGAVFYLFKRYADAVRDGDEIFGVVHAVGGSSEADSRSMVAPTRVAMERAIANALRQTDIQPEQIGVADTHGSANELSDILEAESLASMLRPAGSQATPVQITAIKSHIGHLYGGSGAASALSTLLSLRHRVVPGIRKLETVRPKIQEIAAQVAPRKGTQPLPDDCAAGGVNSLGLGGANYFAIVTGGDMEQGISRTTPKETTGSAFAGRTITRAEDAEASDVFICLAEAETDLGDALGRAVAQDPIPNVISEGEDVRLRMAVTFDSQETLKNKLNSAIRMLASGHDVRPLESQGIFVSRLSEGTSPLAFCLPGQGVHYIGMGRFLYDSEPIFREVVDTVHQLAMEHFQFDMLGHIYGDPKDADIAASLGTLVGAQTSLFAIEVALAKYLMSRGIVPDVMVGHSFGEISALTIAGAWTLEAGYRAVIGRIRAAETIAQSGGPALAMASVVCSEEQRSALLKVGGENVLLTNVNAPGRYVFGGIKEDVQRVVDIADSFGVDARLLPIGGAFHSRFMEPARQPFYEWLKDIPCATPQIPILSTITGAYIRTDDFTPEYLADHLSKQLITPLDLPREINRLHSEGIRHFLEVGPGWAMTKMIAAILDDRPYRVVPTLHPKVGDVETFRRARAFLMATGHIRSAAARQELPGMFSPDFLEYMESREPAVLALLKEVYERYHGSLKGAGSGMPTPTRAAAPALAVTSAPVASAPAPAPVAAPVSASSSVDLGAWVSRLKEKLVVTTGYPAEMLEEDLDLEADLGVDSVQRAEIWVSLVTEHGLDPETRPEGPRTIANLARTLAEMDAVKSGGAPKKALAGPETTPENAAGTPVNPAEFPLPDPADETACQLFAAGVAFLDEAQMTPFEAQSAVLLVEDDKGDAAAKLQRRLGRAGTQMRTLLAADLLAMSEDALSAYFTDCDTLVYLHHESLVTLPKTPQEMRAAFSQQVQSLYDIFRHLYALLQQRPMRIMVPVSMDGRLGLQGQGDKMLGAFPVGFMRGLARELTDCRFQIIDCGDLGWVQGIEANWPWLSPGFEMGMTSMGRVTPVMAQIAPGTQALPTLNPGDLVLVTGGARGIVFECVYGLAHKTGCRLLLTGRTPLPQGSPAWLNTAPEDIHRVIREMEIDLVKNKGHKLPEAKKIGATSMSQWEVSNNLARLAQAGIDARYAVCDVSDAEALRALIAETAAKTPIAGVVHGSGVQKAALANELTDRAVTRTLDTKISPIFTMMESLDWSQVRFVSAFGSIAGLFGNTGQTDYALANDMMAWMVQELCAVHPHIKGHTLEWTAWVGTGMVSEEEGKRFKAAGLKALTVETGVPLFLEAALRTVQPRIAVYNAEASFAGGRTLAKHPLPPVPRVRLVDTAADGTRSIVRFSTDTDSYIHQHLVNLEPVVPGTFVTEIFAEALKGEALIPTHIRFRRPMLLRGESLEVELVRDGDAMMLVPAERPEKLNAKALANLSYASCTLAKEAQLGEGAKLKITKKDLATLTTQSYQKSADFYDLLDTRFYKALKTGPVFRGVRATMEKGDLFFSTVTMTSQADAVMETPGEFVFNPILADMAVQVAAAWAMMRHNTMEIPFEIGALQVAGVIQGRDAIVICREKEITAEQAIVDLAVRNPDGSLIMTMDNLVLKTIMSGDG